MSMYEETRVYTTTTGQRWVPAGPAYDGGNVECNPWLYVYFKKIIIIGLTREEFNSES
jgi:hypothetical protein